MVCHDQADLEALRQNEYLSQRWWELERIEYSSGIRLPLLTVDELLGIDARIVIDTRPFAQYSLAHFKGSFNMAPGAGESDLQTYANFARSYHLAYPDNLMVFIGDIT